MSPTIRSTSEAIKVVFRVRPLNSKEIKDGRTIITKATEDRGSIEVTNPDAVSGSGQTKHFSFDAVFSENSSQRLIYDTCAAPVVESVLQGYNGTIFCYGQTGAGKTHTMEGVVDDPDLRGIIPNAFQHIFDHAALKDSNETMLVRASYFEIYNEEIRDLLSTTPTVGLELKESANSGIYVKGLSSTVVKSFIEIDKVMQMGKKNRSVASTLMNAGSSRSHSVFTVVIESCTKDKLGEDHIRMGKLNLVDLAGSERQTKTGATGDRLKEATKINLSLSALGNVISALVDGKSQHVPYRDSKLTRILQDSLGGNTKTVMCANAGPAEYNYDETLSTLRYANRAKNIKNKPIINEDPKDAMLREYQDEISKLKAQLAQIPTRPGSALRLEEKDLESQLVDASDERKYLQVKLEEESRSRAEIEKQRCELEQKLHDIEASLMSGGDMASKAARQEAELRKAEQALIAKREGQLALARKIEEQEETHLQLNEKYTSLNDEVRSKTKKLKKLWTKYTHMVEEKKEEAREFQSDKSDLLELIRYLNKQLKLKDLIISNFIPPKYVTIFDENHIGGRVVWNESTEEWELPRLQLTGNSAVKPVPTFAPSNMPHSCQTNTAKYLIYKPKIDHTNPVRSKKDTFLDLELHIPKKATKQY